MTASYCGQLTVNWRNQFGLSTHSTSCNLRQLQFADDLAPVARDWRVWRRWHALLEFPHERGRFMSVVNSGIPVFEPSAYSCQSGFCSSGLNLCSATNGLTWKKSMRPWFKSQKRRHTNSAI